MHRKQAKNNLIRISFVKTLLFLILILALVINIVAVVSAVIVGGCLLVIMFGDAFVFVVIIILIARFLR